ncbi:MAG: M48 family metalloprotease [Anaerolineae bacterium]|nr:M48 family metalloprotease [Anaerolineae bacterium]
MTIDLVHISTLLAYGGIIIIGSWLAIQVVLLILGVLLSRFTLAIIYRNPPPKPLQIRKAERYLLYIYRIIIEITAAYYHVHLIMQTIVLGLCIVIAPYFFLSSSNIYLWLLFGISTLGILSGIVILLVNFYEEERHPSETVMEESHVHNKDMTLMYKLSRDEAPVLWELVENVADYMGTRPVDAIYIEPSTGIGVLQYGSWRQRQYGKGRRVLILGLASLPGMTQAQFKAILAHEYGHFCNHDMGISSHALRLRETVNRTVQELLDTGIKCRNDPICIFSHGYAYIYLRITLGASRLQEVLADRYAALTYGVETFIGALKHIILRELVFQTQVLPMLRNADLSSTPYQNLYTLSLFSEMPSKQLSRTFEQMMASPTSPYDSHPSFQSRVTLIRKLPEMHKTDTPSGTVWALFPDATALQEKMTAALVREIDQF